MDFASESMNYKYMRFPHKFIEKYDIKVPESKEFKLKIKSNHKPTFDDESFIYSDGDCVGYKTHPKLYATPPHYRGGRGNKFALHTSGQKQKRVKKTIRPVRPEGVAYRGSVRLFESLFSLDKGKSKIDDEPVEVPDLPDLDDQFDELLKQMAPHLGEAAPPDPERYFNGNLVFREEHSPELFDDDKDCLPVPVYLDEKLVVAVTPLRQFLIDSKGAKLLFFPTRKYSDRKRLLHNYVVPPWSHGDTAQTALEDALEHIATETLFFKLPRSTRAKAFHTFACNVTSRKNTYGFPTKYNPAWNPGRKFRIAKL